ncbi:hypothetical protein HDV01_003375 [Terramyces sp. JEL0728]|nr:hypothetical protein HDV01_003375 [Terramyces sp. JEL0728]
MEHSNESDQTLATVISQDTIQMIKECLKQESKSLLKTKGLFDISSELRAFGEQNKKKVGFSQPLVTFVGQTSTEYYKILQLKRSAMVVGEKVVESAALQFKQNGEEWSDTSDGADQKCDSIPRSLANLTNCSIEIRPPSRLSENSSDSEASPDSISLVSMESEDGFCSKPVEIDLEVRVVDECNPVILQARDNVQTEIKAKLKRMPTFLIKRQQESAEIQNTKKQNPPELKTIYPVPQPAVPTHEEITVKLKNTNLKKKSKFEKEKQRDIEFRSDGKWIEVGRVVSAQSQLAINKPPLNLELKDSAISITTQSVVDRELDLEEISVCSADSAWLNDGIPEEVSVCSADSEWLNEPSLPTPYTKPTNPSPLAYSLDDETSDLSLNSVEDWSVSPIPEYKETISGISKLKQTFRKIFSKK